MGQKAQNVDSNKCLNCDSANVTSKPLASHTDQYTCNDCKFVFTDDDIYDRIPRNIKIKRHRTKFGTPATLPVDEQMWEVIEGLERGDELITDLAGHTDTYLMGQGHTPKVIANTIVNELVEYGRLVFNNEKQAYFLAK